MTCSLSWDGNLCIRKRVGEREKRTTHFLQLAKSPDYSGTPEFYLGCVLRFCKERWHQAGMMMMGCITLANLCAKICANDGTEFVLQDVFELYISL